MRLLIAVTLLACCASPRLAAADAPTTIHDEVRGLVQGAGSGEAIRIEILPRESLPGAAQRIDTVLATGGVFEDPLDFVPGLTDITVRYGAFAKSSRVRVAIEPQELLIRLDWSGGGTTARCRLFVDEIGPLDRANLRGTRRPLSLTGECLYYASAAAGMYPMWVHYEAGSGACTATVLAWLNGRQLFSRQQVIAQPNALIPLVGEGQPASNASSWHVGTFAVSTGGTVGAWRVVDGSGAPAWIGRRTMAPQGALLNAESTETARLPSAVYPLSDATLQTLEGANGTAGVSLTLGQSTIVRAYGLVEDARRAENKPQELLGLTSLQGPASVGLLDARGVFTALAPGSVQAVAKDAKGTTRSITITVTGDATDTDGDGLPDATETAIGTDPQRADGDGDGIGDGYEVRHQLDPVVKDAAEDRDGDGLTNAQEAARGTAADRIDSDGDRISDAQEIAQGSDPTVGGDGDSDRLSDAAERYFGTTATASDSDGDFVSDGIEIVRGTNPLSGLSFPAIYDTDNDGLTTQREQYINLHLVELGYAGVFQLSPTSWDSDGDLLADGYEVHNRMDPTSSNRTGGGYTDTDGDGISDFDEQIYGTSPSLADSDGDGTSDGDEISQGTNPNDPADGAAEPDRDDDGLSDEDEDDAGTDPDDADSDNDGTNDGDEADGGYDPTDPGDHPGDGNGPSEPEEPPHYVRAKMTLVVGDPSGSHSERWNMRVGSPGGAGAGGIRLIGAGFGEVETREFDNFKRGYLYQVAVEWVASNLTQGADFDWRASVNNMGNAVGWSQGTVTVYNQDLRKSSTGPIVIYDQDKNASFSLLQLGEYHGDDTNLCAGKHAYVYLPFARLHGRGDEDSDFPKLAEALPKRSGTVWDPVISIESGGDGAHSGCSLYGRVEANKNRWRLRAIATGPNGQARPSGYSIRWSGIPNASTSDVVDITLPVGRHFPKLIVSYEGNEVATAEIHSLVVEDKAEDKVAQRPAYVAEDTLRGSRFGVTHHLGSSSGGAPPFNMDLRLSAKPGTTRGRVSLDGYPQNEYWVGGSDAIDLPQVVATASTDQYFVQGYGAPSVSRGDLEVQAEVGWAVSNNDAQILDETWSKSDTALTTTGRLRWITAADQDEPTAAVEETGAIAVSRPEPVIVAVINGEPQIDEAAGVVTVQIGAKVYDPFWDLTTGSERGTLELTVAPEEGSAGGGSSATVTPTDDGADQGFWNPHAAVGNMAPIAVQLPLAEGDHRVVIQTSPNRFGFRAKTAVVVRVWADRAYPYQEIYQAWAPPQVDPEPVDDPVIAVAVASTGTGSAKGAPVAAKTLLGTPTAFAAAPAGDHEPELTFLASAGGSEEDPVQRIRGRYALEYVGPVASLTSGMTLEYAGTTLRVSAAGGKQYASVDGLTPLLGVFHGPGEAGGSSASTSFTGGDETGSVSIAELGPVNSFWREKARTTYEGDPVGDAANQLQPVDLGINRLGGTTTVAEAKEIDEGAVTKVYYAGLDPDPAPWHLAISTHAINVPNWQATYDAKVELLTPAASPGQGALLKGGAEWIRTGGQPVALVPADLQGDWKLTFTGAGVIDVSLTLHDKKTGKVVHKDIVRAAAIPAMPLVRGTVDQRVLDFVRDAPIAYVGLAKELDRDGRTMSATIRGALSKLQNADKAILLIGRGTHKLGGPVMAKKDRLFAGLGGGIVAAPAGQTPAWLLDRATLPVLDGEQKRHVTVEYSDRLCGIVGLHLRNGLVYPNELTIPREAGGRAIHLEEKSTVAATTGAFSLVACAVTECAGPALAVVLRDDSASGIDLDLCLFESNFNTHVGDLKFTDRDFCGGAHVAFIGRSNDVRGRAFLAGMSADALSGPTVTRSWPNLWARVDRSVFKKGKAMSGGAIAVYGGDEKAKLQFTGMPVTFARSLFQENGCTWRGGALFIQGVNSSGTHLLDCVLKENKGTVEKYEWLTIDQEMFADGGAISVKDFAAVRIEGGKIEGNSTKGDGGGVYATSFAMVKTDGTAFGTNTSGLGGGLHATFGSLVRVAGCTFTGNTATRVPSEENPVGGSGAGISTRAARILIEDTSFTQNVAEYAGGAIVSFCSRDMRKNPGASWVELEGLLHNITEIRRCTFTGNRSTTYGGGAVALVRSSPKRSDEAAYFGFVDLIKPNAKRKVHHWTMTDCTMDGNVCDSNAADPHRSGVAAVDGVYAKDTNDVFYDEATFRQLLAGAFNASGLLTRSGLNGGDIVAKYAPAYNWAIPDLLTDTFLRNRITGTVAGHARLVVGNSKVPLIPLNPPKFVHDIGMGSVVEPLVVLNP